ncbi:MAG: hypothetical protein CL675_02450 [Bdellovibrionaceae bacterium]|nr:hypothetical protein [Pseudobdellovibrionaceae bacterium]
MRVVATKDFDPIKVADFYEKTSLPGLVELQFHRPKGFLAPYFTQSDDVTSVLLVNSNNEIIATVTVYFREALIEGETQTVGFASDLRVAPTRQAVFKWATYFIPLLIQEREKRNCKYIFSMIAEGQRQALNAFIRPRSARRKLPRYHLYRKLDLVSINGRYPWAPAPLEGAYIRQLTPEDRPVFSDYVAKKQLSRPMSFPFEVENLIQRIPHFDDGQFLGAFDVHGDPIGLLSLWNPDLVQHVVPVHWSKRATSIRGIFKSLSYLGLTKPLVTPTGRFSFHFANHIYADNPDVHYCLLRRAFQEIPKQDFILYPHFEGDLASLPPQGHFTTSTKFGLYLIMMPEDPIPDFLRPRMLAPPPDFELTYL